jgi:transposase-like protein
MDEALQAEKGERTSARLGYRSGHYSRTLVTRVGKIELRVPQDRQGLFQTRSSSAISEVKRPWLGL